MPHQAQPARAAAFLFLAATLAGAAPAAAQGAARVPTLLNQDQVARQADAVYPPALHDRRVEGQVVLRLRVRQDGSVDPASPTVIEATDSAFVGPAMALTREMRFSPPWSGGRTVDAWIRHPVHFRIAEPPPVAAESEIVQAEAGYPLARVEERPQLVNVPQVRQELSRRYPPDLRERGVQGEVVLRFRLLENGRVDAPTITMLMATDVVFEQPAIEVVRLMRFSPARVNGRAVKVFVEVPVQFADQES